MSIRKIMLRLLVVSLLGTSMFLGVMKHSYANSPEMDKSIVIENESIDLQEPLEAINSNLDEETSNVLLENNEALDKLVKNNAFTIESVVDSQKESPIGQKSFSNKEIEMMAKMVYGEARGETIKGQVGVAAVIINRVESPKFPNTVSKVLFQDGAFTAVTDGQFQKSPDHDAYHAVYLAIKGMDPTKEAIFYYNPEIATSDWIFSRPKTVKIGEHAFAK